MHKAILVTGASTGIGNHLAHYLAERGYLVYTAVRQHTDFAALGKPQKQFRNPEGRTLRFT